MEDYNAIEPQIDELLTTVLGLFSLTKQQRNKTFLLILLAPLNISVHFCSKKESLK
jgi:hypothetical protein